MKNMFIALAIVCCLTTVSSVKADGPSFTTSFTFVVRMGETRINYSSDLTQVVDVVMPAIGWECQRSRVNMTDSLYLGGFMCSNDKWKTSVGTRAACAIGKKDSDITSFGVTAAGAKSPVMLIASCITTTKGVPTDYGSQL